MSDLPASLEVVGALQRVKEQLVMAEKYYETAIVSPADLRTLVSEVERLREADDLSTLDLETRDEAESALRAALAATQSRLAETDAALKPFGDVVFNDNGDVTYDYSYIKDEHYWKAYHVRRRNAAFLNAPPIKPEA